jgi:hypothetical protein
LTDEPVERPDRKLEAPGLRAKTLGPYGARSRSQEIPTVVLVAQLQHL